MGRFISVDPIVRGINHTEGISCRQSIGRFPLDKPKKLHPFVYTENNPINLIDPSGLGTCGPGSGLLETLIPDRYPGYNFTSPCASHDKCYATCGKSKDECDSTFLNEMLNVCKNSSIFFYYDCITRAYIYYGAAVTAGKIPYDTAQRENCCKK